MFELRPLRFVHGHRVDGNDITKARRQYMAHARTGSEAASGIGEKRHRQTWLAAFIGHAQADADIAVGQAQVVVVAGDHDRTPFIPADAGFDQSPRMQCIGDQLVEPFHAVKTVAQGAQQLEMIERQQHITCPVIVRGGSGVGSRAIVLKSLQIMAVTVRRWRIAVVEEMFMVAIDGDAGQLSTSG
jgi:hypothetical protein